MAQHTKNQTLPAHRPAQHVAVIEQNLMRVLERARAIGAATHEVLRAQAARRMHPEETLRSAQGIPASPESAILRLAADFSPSALEHACERALALKSYSYRAVRTFIETPEAAPAQPALDLGHSNVRGPKYFQ